MNIVWLGARACHDRDLVGGKAAYLSLLAAEHPVPPGFCLTAHAGDASLDDTLASAYDELARRTGLPAPAVAVRSSALDEDGASASFAGQHDTYLNISGVAAIADAVRRCRASAQAPRALAYRQARGLLAADGMVGVAVLVQHLVVADVAVVAFSANPVTGNRDEVVVTASWGLGESIVGGTVTPDTFHVRKADLRVTASTIAEKARMTVAAPGGTREVAVPRILQRQPTLRPEQVVEVARLALRLEERCGWPVDLEGAFARETLFLLQCRPITTLASPAADMGDPVAAL